MRDLKSTGIVRKIDELGRITLPKEFERTIGNGPKVPMEIFVEGDAIILKKYQPMCGVCKESDDLVLGLAKHGIKICRKCFKTAGGV
jgi:transcriptional pleiotropic regulator of transition state genes